jgi:hypothetical protein
MRKVKNQFTPCDELLCVADKRFIVMDGRQYSIILSLRRTLVLQQFYSAITQIFIGIKKQPFKHLLFPFVNAAAFDIGCK